MHHALRDIFNIGRRDALSTRAAALADAAPGKDADDRRRATVIAIDDAIIARGQISLKRRMHRRLRRHFCIY